MISPSRIKEFKNIIYSLRSESEPQRYYQLIWPFSNLIAILDIFLQILYTLHYQQLIGNLLSSISHRGWMSWVDNLQRLGCNAVKLQSYYLSTASCCSHSELTKKYYEKVGLVITWRMIGTSESGDKEAITHKRLNKSKIRKTESKT